MLRKADRPIELIINKCDHAAQEDASDEFARLGFGSGLPTSAEHGHNIQVLADLIDEHLAPLQEKKS